MPRHVREAQVAVGEHLHLGCAAIVSEADGARVLDGLLCDGHGIDLGADEPHPVVLPSGEVARRARRGDVRLVQRDMLPDEHAQSYAAHVEAIQEHVYLGQVGPAVRGELGRRWYAAAARHELLLELGHAERDHWHDICVALEDALDVLRERRLVCGRPHRRHRAQLPERLDVPVAHLDDRRLVREAHRQILELGDAVRESDGQLVLQELRADDQIFRGGVLAEVHHVLERHARLPLEGAPVYVLHHVGAVRVLERR
mmetsp:Transcript_9952/g.41180  ORF Transcript_9952/g.41180 Transcript_9952/m.41180 type:complete len:257 (+) Transcript_9952:1272-2042(+)